MGCYFSKVAPLFSHWKFLDFKKNEGSATLINAMDRQDISINEAFLQLQQPISFHNITEKYEAFARGLIESSEKRLNGGGGGD